MMHEGKRVTLTDITLERFEDGKIVEAWRCMERLGLLQQAGIIETRRQDGSVPSHPGL